MSRGDFRVQKYGKQTATKLRTCFCGGICNVVAEKEYEMECFYFEKFSRQENRSPTLTWWTLSDMFCLLTA